MNWRTELEQMLTDNEDELEVLVIRSEARPMRPIAVPIDYPVFDREFDGVEGCSFTAWGGKYVYFPATYDGAEWIECVPRNPCLIATAHIGGQ